MRNQINKGVDTAFELKEFIKHNDLPIFQNTKAALKRAAFVANDVAAFFNHLVYLIQCGLRVFHFAFKKGKCKTNVERVCVVRESSKFEETKIMFTVIKGHYEEGKVTLEEMPPTTKKAEVLVIFQGDNNEPKQPNRQFGFAKGIVRYMADDFDEPLEDMKDYM